MRVHHAVGCTGTVYLRIPAHEQGAGKVLINLQDRTIELEAVTSGEEIPTGTQIVVCRMAENEIVQVERIHDIVNTPASARDDEVTHV